MNSSGEKQLPSGWSEAPLGDLLTILRGVSYKKEDATTAPSSGKIPILRATNIDGRLNFTELIYVPQKYVSKIQLLNIGDIVIAASSGSRHIVGKAAALTVPWTGSFGAFCYGLRPHLQETASYISLFLQTSMYRGYISALSAGVNINNLRREHIEGVPLPVAPLNEQRRIAAKIEELFSELDKGVESLKTARAQLYIYRQVMIKHAFEGKLTADWREENKDKLDTPEQLLACIKQERQAYYEMKLEDWKTAIARSGATTKRGRRPRKPNPPLWTNASSRDSSVEDDKLPVSWTSGALGSLFEVVSGATPKGLRHVEGGDLPFYKVSDMNSPGNETRMDAAAMYLSEEQQTELGLTVHPAGTIIFPKRGGAILTNKKRLLSRPACFDLNTMGVINPIVRISTDYLWYWFQSLDLSGIYDGSNVPQINNKDIEPLRVPICTAQEQVEIVRVLERVLSVNDQMKSEIDKELWKASALRQAILTRAFAGQLVAQDPSDEPASVLLDRIRTQKNQQAEREMVTRSTKKKRKTTA